ncbi:hypothetical protein [Bacillus thuringiensis]|uniref:hypothetical protein n=1 Tax=Bacillus thuringiensis TaxID=1428 RepID=UPI001F5B42B4|nr:hypothetical protein [Bacillus thuringiensis]
MQIKCSNCGFEQFVKDHKFNREYKDDYQKSLFVLCGRNGCDTSKIKIPYGYIKEIMWLGSWSIVRDITLEEYKSLKRARFLRAVEEQ